MRSWRQNISRKVNVHVVSNVNDVFQIPARASWQGAAVPSADVSNIIL